MIAWIGIIGDLDITTIIVYYERRFVVSIAL